MTDLEKLIKKIMNEAEANWEPVSYDEAKQMAEAELKAKKDAKHYETKTATATKPKEKKTRPVKISDEKKLLFDTILRNIDRCEGVERENIEILKENKLIQVKIGTKTFKVDLIECRPPKKK
jgi:hypothetical protein